MTREVILNLNVKPIPVLSSAIKVFDLSCQYLNDPVGIDERTSFSWKLASDERNVKQAAFFSPKGIGQLDKKRPKF